MPHSTSSSGLAPFQQQLIGTWTNQPLPGAPHGEGGADNALSYCVMPLPQVTPQKGEPDYPGYILKNFRYIESVRFDAPSAIAIPVTAPNRGGSYQQDAHALFYEQQVKFSQGPANGSVVHVENGAWLWLTTAAQPIGPYGKGGNESGPVVPQPPDLTVAKQISVPHGNSVLALGTFTAKTSGAPSIGNANPPYPQPQGLSMAPYQQQLDSPDDYQNPDPGFTENPVLPLQTALGIIKPDAYMHWQVTTALSGNHQGSVTNIPFEQRVAKVTAYEADYWLLSTDGGAHFNYLAYTQTMQMEMTIKGQTYMCPHVTSNVITRM